MMRQLRNPRSWFADRWELTGLIIIVAVMVWMFLGRHVPESGEEKPTYTNQWYYR